MEKSVRGRGRPRKELPTTAINFRMEVDLHEWVNATKGKKSMNQYINDIIREKAGLLCNVCPFRMTDVEPNEQ